MTHPVVNCSYNAQFLELIAQEIYKCGVQGLGKI